MERQDHLLTIYPAVAQLGVWPSHRSYMSLKNKKRERRETGREDRRAVQAFRSGEAVATSGIYRVVHYQHRLAHEVTLLQGGIFPPCMRCGTQVLFELLRGVRIADFKVRLNALPEVA